MRVGACGYNAVGHLDKEHSVASYLNLSDVEKKQIERFFTSFYKDLEELLK